MPLSDRCTPAVLFKVLFLATAVAALPSRAQEPVPPSPQDCDVRTGLRPATASFRVDNDLFGGRDAGYTSGATLNLASPNVTDYELDPCLPAVARFLNRGLGWLQPDDAEQKNMSLRLSQALFTPTDNERSDLITNDRPYAAVLLASIGYHGVRGDLLDSRFLRLGWIGPSAKGEESQRAVHRLTDSKQFRGWSNQLHDEPVFQLHREWTGRGPRSAVREGGGGWGWDSFWHGGGSLGTLATGAIVGGQIRYGKALPDDFGSHPT